MARVTPMRANEFSEELRDALCRPEPPFDGPPEMFKLLAMSPSAFRAYTKADEALANGKLSPQHRLQIALAVSEINGSTHDIAIETQAARAAALPPHDVALARRATATDPMANRMLKFVQALVLQRGQFTDGELTSLRQAGFADGEIVEVVANVALTIFTNYLNLVAATEQEGAHRFHRTS